MSVADLTDEMVEALDLPERRGALVQAVADDLPAAKAGIAPRDVIVSIAGLGVRDAAELRLRVASHRPGERVAIGLYRDGVRVELEADLVDLNAPYRRSGLAAAVGELLPGVAAVLLDRKVRAEHGIDARLRGLLVVQVQGDSPYARYLPSGSVIVEINGTEPQSLEHARKLLMRRPGSRLYVYNKGQYRYLSVKPD